MGTSHLRQTPSDFDRIAARILSANRWHFVASVALAFALLLFLQGNALAAKVTVSPHGQEDFLTIQEAIDGVAPGDTIVVGLGIHQTGYTTRNEQGTYRTVLGWIDKPLTFMGDSTNGIIRGPSDGETYAFFSLGNLDLNFVDVRIEDVSVGIGAGAGGEVVVRACQFEHVRVAVVVATPKAHLSLSDTVFVGVRKQCVISNVGAYVLARNCSFGLDPTRSGGLAVLAANGGRAEIENCSMSYGGFVEVNSGGTADIRDCTSESASSSILECFGASSSLRVQNVTAQAIPIGNGTPIALRVRQGLLEAENVTLSGFWRIANCQSSGTLIVDNSQFLDWIDEYAVHVLAYPTPGPVLNLENNYWGTTDLDSIAASIYDGNDDPEASPFGFVSFTPIAQHPLPTASESLGSVKSKY